jgi:hypothetical protein
MKHIEIYFLSILQMYKQYKKLRYFQNAVINSFSYDYWITSYSVTFFQSRMKLKPTISINVCDDSLST